MTREQMLAVLVAANGGEAIFRPSSISRLIHCVGSIQLTAKAPKVKRSSFAAREGTAAHAVSEDCLKNGRDPSEWVGRRIVTHDDPEGFFVDEEMGETLPLHIETIAERCVPGAQMLIEQKLSLSALDPAEPLFAQNKGTADCVIIDPSRRKLSIVDLKYGKGVMVAGDAPQLKNYALLGMLTYPMPGGWAEVETVVTQVRAFNENDRVKAFTFNPEEILTDFIGMLVGAMDASLGENPVLAPDPTGGYCRWCPAKAICPALRDVAINIGRDAFDAPVRMDVGTALTAIPQDILIGEIIEPVPAGALVLPQVVDLDPSEVATILDREVLFDTFYTGIKQRAVQFLEAGVNVPGYKLVQRSGNRRFKEDPVTWTVPEWFTEYCAQHNMDASKMDVQTVLRALGVKTSDMFTEPKLKSPAQIEKTIPKKDRNKIDWLLERPLGAATLVAGTDDRPALESALGPIS